MAGICANSSQAKGRVKRANLTLQERLVKEMCTRISPAMPPTRIETFISDFNHRFARLAKYPKNLHRTV
ncbi:hypothetical protein EAO24_29925 [Klebsiella pneumoniae]|nr:hypothetical protein EAO24_29925 [Klebsiella pneumoniae]